MPPSIIYKDLPIKNDLCGESAQNAAVFLRENIQSIDPNQDGVLSAQEISNMGLRGQSFLKKLQIFKKNYLQLRSDKCEIPKNKNDKRTGEERLEELFKQGELLLKDLGFRCKKGFWTCSRPSVTAKSNNASRGLNITPQPTAPVIESDKGPFQSKDDLENALYDQEIFGKEKYLIFDAKRNDRDGYFPINLALIETRKFLVRESDGNAALAVVRIKEWLSIPTLRNVDISLHVRKKLKNILLRIPHGQDEVYNRGVQVILKAINAYYGKRTQKIAEPTSIASIPVVIIPRRARIASEFDFPFFPTSKESKRVHTAQDFQRTYFKLISQSLSTAFPIKLLKADLQVFVEPINGCIKRMLFTNVKVEGDELDQLLVQSILRGMSEKLRVNYRFKKGVENLTKTISFNRMVGNDSARR